MTVGRTTLFIVGVALVLRVAYALAMVLISEIGRAHV